MNGCAIRQLIDEPTFVSIKQLDMSNYKSTDKEYWDQRYEQDHFAYGKAPNLFFKAQIDVVTPGTILLPADGEARNGVYAAVQGWDVTSIDLSIAAKHKAQQLAKEKSVALNYIVDDIGGLELATQSFDAVALIYAHFAADKKSEIHKKITRWLKPGGVVILEAFSKDHMALVTANPKVGGPKDIAMLFSEDEISEDFLGLETVLLQKTDVILNEGAFHIGTGSVIRYVGRKPFANNK